jgi:DNA polymerase III psi subunit
MSESVNLEWLEAMGIDVWVSRDEPQQAPVAAVLPLKICPGRGSTLLICGHGSDTASPLAADILRSLGGDPVWGWPQPDSAQQEATLESSVRERLFTQVLVFGRSLAETLFSGSIPETVESARVLCAASLPELSHDANARQKLWSLVNTHHLAARR